MTYSDLEQLFYNGDLENCIIQGERYLKEHPEDTNVLFLLATAYHDIVYYDGQEFVFDAIENYTIPYLRRTLAIDKDHKQALYNILDYPLTNEAALRNIGIEKKHIHAENEGEFEAYAKQLIDSEDLFVNGWDFLWRIKENLEEPEQQLLVADNAINVFKERFASNRELREKNISYFWIKKIQLLNNLPEFNNQDLIPMIKAQLPTLVTNEAQRLLDLAEIAHEQGEIDLALAIMILLLDCPVEGTYLVDDFADWSDRFGQLILDGYDHPDVFYFQLILEKNYPDDLGFKESYYYEHALEIIELFPDRYYGYHFAGSFLFENKDYEKAIPYLEKSILISPVSTTIRRYIEAHLYVHHTLPDIPMMQSDPKDIYEDATLLDDLATEIDIPELSEALNYARLIFYKQAYQGLHDYLDKNEYQSYYRYDHHLLAMCCNNLAIVYDALGQYEDAANIAEEGIDYSDFWEINATLIEILIKAERWDIAKVALDRFFDSYDEDEIPFLKHLIFLVNRVEVDAQLHPNEDVFEDTKILQDQIYDFGVANPDMDHYDYRDFEAAKTAIQAVFFKFIEDKTNAEKIALFEKQAARYPHEANPQYMLMQLYHDTEQYKKCNDAAQNYIQNKPAYLMDSFDKARTVHYLLKTYTLCNEYEKGLIVYQENYRMMREVLADPDYITWLYYVIQLKFELGHTEELPTIIQDYKAIYAHSDWGYDKEMEQVYLLHARSLYKEGNLKEANAILDEVLSYSDHDPIADTYKKEWKKPGFFSRFGL